MKPWQHPLVYVKATPNKGFGLFAKGRIAEGELLCITVGQLLTPEEVKKFPMPYHTFQIELGIQMAPIDLTSLAGIFTTNHSCEPNAAIRNGASLVALYDIQPDEEICYDYATTDCSLHDVTVSMECQCGSLACRKTITDRDWTRPEIQKRYEGLFSTYLAEIIAQANSSYPIDSDT